MASKENGFLRALTCLMRLFIVPIVFHSTRLIQDQVFLKELGNERLKPSILFSPIVFVVRAWRRAAWIFRTQFNDYALRKYMRYIKNHYGPGGRGYHSYGKLGDAEKIRLYGAPRGRIADFIAQHLEILGYRNGDSFFEAGCGRGQNLKVLSEAFDASPIFGTDVSEEAVEVVALAASDSRLTVWVSDLTNPATLRGIADNAYDHVVISHVLSILLGAGTTDTRRIRQEIVDHLIRIAGKSVLLIDGRDLAICKEEFVIEQRDRGAFKESMLAYFPADRGRLVTLLSESSFAAHFRK